MEAPFTEFSAWLERWALEPDGWPFGTTYTRSLLMPVRASGRPAMLKIAREPTEEAGNAVMAWWGGEGAAPVLAHAGPALLMARAEGGANLIDMVADGRDEDATAIACRAVAGLHRPRDQAPPSSLETSETWFRALRQAAGQGGDFARAWQVAQALLAERREQIVLHGDIHHGNILDFGPLGWLAIDPKGLIGERAYDYANLLRNPDMATAMQPGRIHRQVAQIAALADLDPRRLARWGVAHAGLSAAWCVEDGMEVAAARQSLAYLLTELTESPG